MAFSSEPVSVAEKKLQKLVFQLEPDDIDHVRFPHLSQWHQWSEFDQADYFSIPYYQERWQKSSAASISQYQKDMMRVLRKEFPLLAVVSLNQLMALFNWRYALAYRGLQMGIAKFLGEHRAKDLIEFTGSTVLVELEGTGGKFHIVRLKVNLATSNLKDGLTAKKNWETGDCLMPELLREMQWVKARAQRIDDLREQLENIISARKSADEEKTGKKKE